MIYKIQFFLYNIFLILILVSCDKPNKANIKSDNKVLSKVEILKMAEYVGRMHNLGLHSVYKMLYNKGLSIESKEHAIQLSKSTIQNFIKSKNYDEKLEKMMIENIEKVFNKMDKIENSKNLWPDELEDKVSAKQKKYLSRINDLFPNSKGFKKKSGEKNTPKLTDIIDIEEDAIENLEGEDLLMVLSASSVYKYSNYYWHYNYQRWNEVISLIKENIQKIDELNADRFKKRASDCR